jgi:hypothetical protein
MFKILTSPQAVEWSTAALVFVSGALVGREASVGMSAIQWTGGVAAVLGSVVLAVMVRAWPARPQAQPARR